MSTAATYDLAPHRAPRAFPHVTLRDAALASTAYVAPRAFPHVTLRDAALASTAYVAPRAFPAERRSRVHGLDGLACALAAATERLALPTARAAAAFEAAKGWRAFGDARLDDHAREHFARSGRWLREQARLHAAVTRWPPLAAALTGDDGGAPIGAEKTKLLARLGSRLEAGVESGVEAGSESGLEAWIARARRLSVPALRREVQRTLAGDGDPSASELEPRVVVTLAMPRSVATAFDEVCDLARAVLGRETSLEGIVDALVAEAGALVGESGPAVVDTGSESGADRAGLRARPTIDRAPEIHDPDGLRSATAGLRTAVDPPAPVDDFEVAFRARTTLAEFRRLASCAGQGDAHELHDQLRRLIALEDTLLRRLGEIGAELVDHGAWGTLPYRGLGDYAERRLGLAATTLEDRVRAARALARRPALREAYDTGTLPFESALLVLRATGARGTTVADDDAERAWLARAREATVKRLRDEVRVVRGRAARDASAPARPLTDAAWCASLRREPGQTRRAVLELGLLAAAECTAGVGAARVGAAGVGTAGVGTVGVGTAGVGTAGTATAPGIFQRLRLPESLAARFVEAIEAARRGLTELAGTVPWDAPWPHEHSMPSVLAARAFSTRARRVPAWVGLLALLENAAMTWDDPRAIPRRPADDVYRRAGYRCEAPGCTARADLHEHHLVFRSRGGGDELENRVVLCEAHHKLLHESARLAAAGRAPDGVTWTKAGTRYRCERRL